MHGKPADCCGFDKINYPGIRSYRALCILFTSLTGGKITSHPRTAEKIATNPCTVENYQPLNGKFLHLFTPPKNYPQPHIEKITKHSLQKIQHCQKSALFQQLFTRFSSSGENCDHSCTSKSRNKIYSTKIITGTFLGKHKCSSFVYFSLKPKNLPRRLRYLANNI
jgi:hypothetical protein